MTHLLPPNLLALFAPRKPVQYMPPAKNARPGRTMSGLGAFINTISTDTLTGPVEELSLAEMYAVKQRRAEKIAQRQEKLAQDFNNYHPDQDAEVIGDAYKTLFVFKLSFDVTEADLREEFERMGEIARVRIVRTPQGQSRGYGFVVFERERDMKAACRTLQGLVIKGREIKVDVERGRTVKDWRPKRLGGGLGGRFIPGQRRQHVIDRRERDVMERDARPSRFDRPDRPERPVRESSNLDRDRERHEREKGYGDRFERSEGRDRERMYERSERERPERERSERERSERFERPERPERINGRESLERDRKRDHTYDDRDDRRYEEKRARY